MRETPAYFLSFTSNWSDFNFLSFVVDFECVIIPSIHTRLDMRNLQDQPSAICQSDEKKEGQEHKERSKKRNTRLMMKEVV